MELRSDFFLFLPTQGSGPVTKTKSFTFLRRVKAATAGITAYKVEYEKREDHHLGQLSEIRRPQHECRHAYRHSRRYFRPAGLVRQLGRFLRGPYRLCGGGGTRHSLMIPLVGSPQGNNSLKEDYTLCRFRTVHIHFRS